MEKLTAQIAAMYLGCEVQYPDTDGRKVKAKLTGVSMSDGLETTYKRKRGNCKGDYLAFKENGHHNTNAFNCKLILKPLNTISDEDAIGIAEQLAWQDSSKPDEMGMCAIGKGLALGFTLNTNHSAFQTSIRFANYLRSRSYDCDNLIQSGIAITLSLKTKK